MAENEKPFSTRWRYYIDRSFQNQFMLRFALVVVLVAAMMIGALWLLSVYSYELLPDGNSLLAETTTETLSCTVDGAALQVPRPPQKFYNALQLYWRPIVLMSMVNLILIVVFGLFYSHSMAGPIHNIKESLRDMIGGSPPREIQIRKGDQFQEVVDLLNQLIKKRVK
ncbi:MAG: hypothetical protein H7A21_09995 [Spirochaetales bacterium]|nr:hypothetical protein [Leptospiraceae bacterium]MCP5481754.1 hypothetical protein [Spirochaetales bacterium]